MKAYELAKQAYEEYTDLWIKAVENNENEMALFYRAIRYKFLDIMNLLDPESENEKVGGFIL